MGRISRLYPKGRLRLRIPKMGSLVKSIHCIENTIGMLILFVNQLV